MASPADLNAWFLKKVRNAARTDVNELIGKPGVPPSVLESALQELGFLWLQWREAIRSSDSWLEEVRDLESRIASYQDITLMAGRSALPELGQYLSVGEPDMCFASAWALLSTRQAQAGELVLETLRVSKDEAFLALRDACCYVPLDVIKAGLEKMLRADEPMLAVIAAEILSFHGSLAPEAECVLEFLSNEVTEVRVAAWRVIALNEYLPKTSSTYTYD